ncbi:HEAT repeat domain-containing protein [Tolypothrix sp. NIES-4075]|uniref:HEAT repeat domain-containing protein n=1 Tax=Tolypothrix sp. NIES-4075 TaxID=2005459 RepID=UPI001F3FFAE4|nr:HEAT repeat domain-containing protein [Tolypothrix sp. NIES-4075]
MKLIKQTTLHYQDGTSDKIYEVDLCQTGKDRYVVNFRYGRRGTNLKEGTKTTSSVPLAQAEQAFDKLVGEKTKKGYRELNAQPVNLESTPRVEKSENARKEAILNRLADDKPSKSKLERAIWRAGELKISEATPLLIKLIGTGEPLRDYCIAWALGWCGDDRAIAPLTQLYNNLSNPEFVRRIAFEALLKLSDAEERASLQAQQIEFLPPELQNLTLNGSSKEFATALSNYLKHDNYKHFPVLDTIYQIDNQYVRPALLDILCTSPFKPNYFKQLRHIFKMAEYRHDAEVFGILAYRLEIEKAGFSSESYYVSLPSGGHLRKTLWGNYNRQTGRYEYKGSEVKEELKHPESRIAYSSNTREYLLRRVWRTLKQLGEESDPDYVKMAVGVLLQYSDEDAEEVRESVFYRWNSSTIRRNWDAFAGYLTFNHILYQNSPRYELKTNSQAWCCREGYKPGDPEPAVREEAFGQLWEQNPDALLHLLLQSECDRVHHFAVKVLRTCDRFCASIDIPTIIQLVNQRYEVTAQFAFELALLNYNSTSPNIELVLALANCVYERARTQAYRWIDEKREYFLQDSNAIAALVTSQQTDTRIFARRLLTSTILTDTTAKVLIGRIIAKLLTLSSTQGEMAEEIGETLLISFAPQLRNLGLSVINDLLTHPLVEIQELGVQILLNHEISAENLPSHIIESLLASPYELVQVLGIRLFGQLPDEKLIGEESILIVAMAVNTNAEIRNAIQPIIHRLGAAYPAFTIELASDFIEVLLTPEKHEGIHSYLVRLLREDLQGWMTSVTKETALNLLAAKSSAAQELGGVVLGANSNAWITEFAASEIVKLANHEILSVREAARQMFLQILNRLRLDSEEMLSAVRMLESKWQDSREFAFKIFTTEFGSEEFTPKILVSICDSVREDARRLGRNLLTRNFQQADGQEYLLKFSEHPSADMQLFATNYLQEYAVDNPERLRELMPYFISVLCRVNSGRVAKKRIFAFLDAEAQKSEEAAKVVAEVMTRQSLTMAIGDKAKAIQIMLKIHKNYPQFSLPIDVKAVCEVRM